MQHQSRSAPPTDAHRHDYYSAAWPHTRWSHVGRAADALSDRADELNSLILAYSAPLKDYLLTGFPSLSGEADALIQDFMQDKVMREGWLTKADRNRGRFRDFLKRSLFNFVRDCLRKQDKYPQSLDAMEADFAAEEKGSEAFDTAWIKEVLVETLQRMEAHCHRNSRQQPAPRQIWAIFHARTLSPILEGADPEDYVDLVDRLGLSSIAEAQNKLATAKRMFDKHLQRVVADYAGRGEAARLEVQALRNFLARLSGSKKE